MKYEVRLDASGALLRLRWSDEGYVDTVGIRKPEARIYEGHVLSDELFQTRLDGNAATDQPGRVDSFDKTREALFDGAPLCGRYLLHGYVLLDGQKNGHCPLESKINKK